MTREEAFQEFWDNVMHPSLKPNISEEAKAVAMVALEEPERKREQLIAEEIKHGRSYVCSACGHIERRRFIR